MLSFRESTACKCDVINVIGGHVEIITVLLACSAFRCKMHMQNYPYLVSLVKTALNSRAGFM